MIFRSYFLAALALLLLLLSASPLSAHDEPNPDTVLLREILQELKGMREELRTLRESVDDLEKNDSDLSRFAIKTIYPDGSPAAGVEVKVRSWKMDREIERTGTSDAEGTAIDHQLPYGKYKVDLVIPDKWAVTLPSQTVEFQSSYAKTITVPADEKPSELRIQNFGKGEGLGQLKFGAFYQTSRGYGTSSPEPGEDPRIFESFPSLGNGIVDLAYQCEIHCERDVTQTDGTTLTWKRWGLNKLLITSENLMTGLETESHTIALEKTGRYFLLNNSRQEGAKPVRFEFLKSKTVHPTRTLSVPSGRCRIEVEGIYGLADGDVARELMTRGTAEVGPGSLLLEARLDPDSEWKNTLFDEDLWMLKNSRENPRVATGIFETKPGETVDVRYRE